MDVINGIKNLFVESAPAVAAEPSRMEIRTRIAEAARNMETRSREAEMADRKAQAALQATFQQGLGMAKRSKLLAEYQNHSKQAKMYMSYANQLGEVLSTLEEYDTYLELSEAISQSGIAGDMDIQELVKELQKAQAVMKVIQEECERLKRTMETETETFGSLCEPLPQENQGIMGELMGLYIQLDQTTDPVKKAEIQAKIQQKNEELLVGAES